MIVLFFLELPIRILSWLFFEILVVQTISIQCFYFLLSAVIVKKKISGAALGAAVGTFFAFIFQTQHS